MRQKAKNGMSLPAICCVTIRALGLLQLPWLALRPLLEEIEERGGKRVEDMLALHARHFPQLRQALANLDDEYLRREASGEIEWHLHAERKHVVQGFLARLAEDFGRLERLMAVVQTMSPAEPWIQQFERAGSRFEFLVNYRMSSPHIHSDELQATNRLTRLTELVGNLSVRIGASIARSVGSRASFPLRWSTDRRLLAEINWRSRAVMHAASLAASTKRLLCNAARWYSIPQIAISGSWAGPIMETPGSPSWKRKRFW
jgi:hypothetical protein